MEAVGTMSEVEWTSSSFTGMCSDDADFMAQLLGNCSLPNEAHCGHGPSPNSSASFWPGNESNADYLGGDQSSLFSFSLGSGTYAAGNGHECYFPFVNHPNLTMSMDGDEFLNQEASDDSVASDVKPSEDARKVKETPVPEPSETSKRRPRSLGDFQKNKRMKKCAKVEDCDNSNDNNKTSNMMPNKQSSSACCSEDESNASHEANGVTSSTSSKGSGALNLSGKTRASRGSATDPQSLYARKRREKINERLKILQRLVPNGTKVDISTMLEEAVEYVKFLQLQIKLLSSDELWMYAPIAYNGMDIGLDLKFPPPRPQS